MKQKRQQFHKQIRRQTLQKIFTQKRQQLLSFNNIHKQQFHNQQLSTQINNQLARYSQELNEGLQNENIQNIFSSIKDSFYEIKKLLSKNKQNGNIQNSITQTWFKLGFNKLLMQAIKMFQKIDKNCFCAIRKQIYRYSVMHFYTVFRLNNLIWPQVNIEQVLNFLFLTLIELSSQPQSINQIIMTVIFLFNDCKQARHQFLFRNYKLQLEENQQFLSFQNIVFIMFQNREKFSHTNHNSQEGVQICREIKMNFIYLFKELGYELKEMEKYIESCRKAPSKNKQNNNLSQVQKIYQQTLRIHGFPSEIKLKHFLQKETLAVITEIINSMRQFYLDNWSQKGENQEYLAECIQATRLLIDFGHNYKIIKALDDQLGDIINLLTIHNLNIQVKNETIFLIDSIIYFDEQNIVTDFMVRNHNLFQKLWSYHQESAFYVKMNAVNNLLLCTAGFQAINKYLSEIAISLHGTTKWIGLALTFLNNYFIQTKYDLYPKTRVELLIQLLYSLPGQFYTVENLELQFYILTHLYDNGFDSVLPERYEEWQKQLGKTDSDERQEKIDEMKFSQILSRILDIYSHYKKQSYCQIMENE